MKVEGISHYEVSPYILTQHEFAFGKQSDNSLSLCSIPTANRETPLGQSNFLTLVLSLLSSKKPLLGWDGGTS